MESHSSEPTDCLGKSLPSLTHTLTLQSNTFHSSKWPWARDLVMYYNWDCPNSPCLAFLLNLGLWESFTLVVTSEHTLTSMNQIPIMKAFISLQGVHFCLLRAPNRTPNPQEEQSYFLNEDENAGLGTKEAHWAFGDLLLMDWRTWGPGHWMNGTLLAGEFQKKKARYSYTTWKTNHLREKKSFLTLDMALRI